MSDADQHDPSEQTAANSQQPEGVRLPTYAVVPASGNAMEDELYAFRTTIDKLPPEQDAPPEKPNSVPLASLALGAVAIVCVVALFLVVPMLMKPKPPALYIDMGNRSSIPQAWVGASSRVGRAAPPTSSPSIRLSRNSLMAFAPWPRVLPTRSRS